MASYEDYGYGPTMTRSASDSGQVSDAMISSADARLMIGNIGASQISSGNITGDLTISDGRIVIKEGEREFVVIDRGGIRVKDESGEFDRVIIGEIS
jgi:hypothetical protein